MVLPTLRQCGVIFFQFLFLAVFAQTHLLAGEGVVTGPHYNEVVGAATGELLLGELNCVACHPASPDVAARLQSRRSPRIGSEAASVTPGWLRAFLTNPQKVKPGSLMPDLLHRVDADAKAESVEALTHFLSSLNPVQTNSPGRADWIKGKIGSELFHSVGCVACHAPQEPADLAGRLADESVPFGDLTHKYTVRDLAAFLRDPSRTRPSGRMPSLNLSNSESESIATYLLRDQAPDGFNPNRTVKSPGLVYEYFEASLRRVADIDPLKPRTNGVTSRISTRLRLRDQNFALRFTGLIHIAQPGDYTFHLSSDDGSQLSLDGILAIDNEGEHAAAERSGKIKLDEGDHAFELRYFNLGGPYALRLTWEGPNFAKRGLEESVLFHGEAIEMSPPGNAPFPLDPGKVARGRELFVAMSCSRCHDTVPGLNSSSMPGPALAAIKNPSGGCLADSPAAGLPQFALSKAQRTSLREVLQKANDLSHPLDPPLRLRKQLAALNCYACHNREESGGPTSERAVLFKVINNADLGDEGRMPPHLTRVGDKLRPGWVREVLFQRGSVRPYMATRMPQFGSNVVATLPELFDTVDSSHIADSATDATLAPTGLRLTGTGGFSCIQCHVFAGHNSLGIPALDLTTVPRRLKKDWFVRYLMDPQSLRPGTRMPSFFPEGKSANADVFHGDPRKQIDALWAYFSRAGEVGLPSGLVVGEVELVAQSEAVLYRNFIDGSARSIGVGYPEKANLTWDANTLRLALIWQGQFLDIAKHRDGRGADFISPLGYNVLKMPEGPTFAQLSDSQSLWPKVVSVDARMRGYDLDSIRRPSFHYSLGSVQVEDFPTAATVGGDVHLNRSLILRANSAPMGFWFRAWRGAQIEKQPDGSFLCGGKVRLRLETSGDSQNILRESAGEKELLVPVRFINGEARINEDIFW